MTRLSGFKISRNALRHWLLFGAVLIALGSLSGSAPAADLPEPAAAPVENEPMAAALLQVESASVSVSNDVTGTFTRTHLWDISKKATPDQLYLFDGAAGTVDYDVLVTNTGKNDVYAITGDITITNDGTVAATIQTVSASIAGLGAATVTCVETLPFELAVGSDLDCDYMMTAPDATTRDNTVTVTLSDAPAEQTVDPVVFGSPTEVNKTITVTDTNKTAGLGTATAGDPPKTFEYRETENCAGAVWDGLHGERSVTNTATIVETKASATETVDVDCYKLGVSKTVVETLGLRHIWSVDKTSSTSRLDLDKGERRNVTYDITVTNTRTTTDGWFVDGVITITNPAPMAAVVDVTDVLSRSGAADVSASVDCDGDGLDVTVPAASSKTCDYHAVLPNGNARTNTATVKLDGIGTTFTAMAAVDFTGVPSSELDERVTVYDDNGTPGSTSDDALIGNFAAGQTYRQTHTAGLYFGSDCGNRTYVNTVRLVGGDTGTMVRDSHSIAVSIDCGVTPAPAPKTEACTYGHGYWKNHMDEAAWNQLGTGTAFFKSGQTYAQVIGTNSRGGNAYYILARQYIATKLNMLNGGNAPAAAVTAFNQATTLFSNYTPAQIGEMKGNDPVRKQFIHLSGDLGNFGGGSCGD